MNAPIGDRSSEKPEPPNRVAEGIDPAPTPPDIRVRVRRFLAVPIPHLLLSSPNFLVALIRNYLRWIKLNPDRFSSFWLQCLGEELENATLQWGRLAFHRELPRLLLCSLGPNPIAHQCS
jgi:hypothetical protein